MCRGGEAHSRGHSFIQQKLLSTHQVLGIVVGPRETVGSKQVGSLPSGSLHSSGREAVGNCMHVRMQNPVDLNRRV